MVSRPQRESVRAGYHRGSAVPSRQVLRDARPSPRLPRAVFHGLLVRPFAAIFPAICVAQPQTFRYLSPGGHVRRARFRRNSRSANRVDCACIRRLGRRGSKFRKPADLHPKGVLALLQTFRRLRRRPVALSGPGATNRRKACRARR